MTAGTTEIVERLASESGYFHRLGERIIVDGPEKLLSEELIAELRQLRPALLRHLADADPRPRCRMRPLVPAVIIGLFRAAGADLWRWFAGRAASFARSNARLTSGINSVCSFLAIT